jgi:hypothetical protein
LNHAHGIVAGDVENAGREWRSAGAARPKWAPARIVRANVIFRFVGEKGNEAKELMRGISWPQR